MSYDDETVDDDQTAVYGEDLPEESEEEPDPTTKYALYLSLGVAGLVILAATWLWYIANDEWYWVLVPLLLVVGTCYLLYRREPTLSHQAFLTTICLVHTWLVFFTETNFIAFVAGAVLIVLMIRVILIYARGTEREAILESFRKLEQPLKVNDRLAIHLNGDERYVIATHMHVIDTIWWFVAMAAWFAMMVVTYLFTDLNFIAFLVLLSIGELALAVKPLLWHREVLCLTTDKRLFVLQGILQKPMPETAIGKIADQTPVIPRLSTIYSWMRIIKAPYGYFTAETAGQSQAKVKIENKMGPIPDILAFKRAIAQMMTSSPKGDD